VVLRIARRRRIDDGQQRAIAERLRARLVSAEAFGHLPGPRDSAVGQDIGVLLLDLFPQPGKAALAHHELHARFVLVLAVAVRVEDRYHGFDPVQQALFRHELMENLRFGGQWSEAAADDHPEPAPAVANEGPQTDIVDGTLDTVRGGAAV